MAKAANNALFEAALPQPYTILGLRLRPFCLGHYLTLQRHGSSFVSEEIEAATSEDLIFAVLVCSMTFEGFCEWLDAEMGRWDKAEALWRFVTFRSSTVEMMLALSGRKAQYEVSQWGRNIGLFDLKEKAQLFLNYLNEGSKVPKVWFEKDGKPGGAHWSQALLQTLTGEVGLSKTEALNLPLREAWLLYFGHAESLGIVRIMTDDELEEITANGP